MKLASGKLLLLSVLFLWLLCTVRPASARCPKGYYIFVKRCRKPA